MTIIDRDIQFYSDMVDQHIDNLRNCYSGDEHRHRANLKAARAILDALREYRFQILNYHIENMV